MTARNGPFLKDPGDRVDYTVDFNAADAAGDTWLDGDTLAAVSWTVPSGLTTYATSNTTTTATVWLSGGTHGRDHTVTCAGTTAGGRIKQQSFVIKVRNDVA